MNQGLQAVACEAAVDIILDVDRAIETASANGWITGFQRFVLYVHYWLDVPLCEIAEHARLHEAAVRRDHRAALDALKRTGCLEGYRGFGEDEPC